MKTQMQMTSLLAHDTLVREGKLNNQEQMVLKVLDEPLTSREIAKKTGLERTSVCGRLNSLVHKQYVKAYDMIKCAITRKNVHRYVKAW